MKSRQLLMLYLAVTVLFFIVSCKPKKAPEEITEVVFTEEMAKHVSYVSSGNLLPGEPLRVEFAEAQVSEDVVGKEQENTILDFSPSVKGNIKWSDVRTLTFIPEEGWEMRKLYNVKVDLSEISQELKEVDEKLEFSIYIEGQEIEIFAGELVLKERNDPKKLKYTGKVSFKIPVEEDDLKSGFSIKKGGKTIKLNIENTGDNKTYTYTTEELVRGQKSAQYAVKLDKGAFGLESDYTSAFEITPIQKMLVKRVSREESGRHPRIRVMFSDDIDMSQDISSYFSVSPEVKLKISKSGNTVIVDGAFKFGEAYTLTVKPGVKSRWATVLDKSLKKEVQFSDLDPMVEFASDGIILPTANNSKLQFMTSNVSRVHLQVKKVFHNNIADFIRNEEISGAKKRHNGFTRNYGGQVGVILLNKTLEIGDTKNEWLLNEVDLSSIIQDDTEGLYLVRLNFNPRDILVGTDGDMVDYVAENGSIFKPLVVSNLGITAKREDDDHYHVFVTDLITTKPVANARVKAYRYWDDSYSESGTTGSAGYVRLNTDYGIRFITAEKNGQISYLKLDNMQWNTSGFDISGVSMDYSGQRAFIYSERGVYRPGDEINLSMIIRNQDNTFPTNHPATLTLFNPDGQNVMEFTNSTAKDGFYNFNFKTGETDPTGNWEARISAGSRNFYHTIKVETVVPFKLKVRMEADQKKITAKDPKFDLKVRSNYLFGAPAVGLSYETEVQVSPRRISFPKYQGFEFNNEYSGFSSYNQSIAEGALDSSGFEDISWTIPQFEEVSSGLTARFVTTVYEKGGRPNTNRMNIPIDNFDHYVGIQKPSYRYRYITTNEESSIQVICVNTKGKAVQGKKLLYRIYQNNSHWWYHYDNRRDYQLRYKTDNNTTLVKEGSITSGTNPVNLMFTPREDGDYLIEIQEGGYDGHKVTQFLYAYAWGSVPSGDQNAGTLIMKADKAKYNVGDVAKIRFPAPENGAILFTLERESEIIEWKWINNTSKKGEDMEIEIPISEDMVPNTYLTLSVIQPHAQTENDRPMRMFGILPLHAEDPSTRREVEIISADELKPNRPFEVTVQTKDRQPAQFTIAVVDEGLLDLTGFRTPNPWREFFRKLRLNVLTYDVFSQIIGVNKGDVFKAFSIGGDMDFREQQLNPRKGRRRFKPVSLFKGPVMTDNNGRATVKFNMPDYNGSVRIMVVAAKGHSYGHAEKTVPVRTDLMIQPSIPRVLGPDEEFLLPVNVFAMKENVGKVKVSVKVEGPLVVDGKKSQELTFKKITDDEVFFRIKTQKAVGQAKIVVTAASSKLKVNSKTDIMVRPSSPRQYSTEEVKVNKGSSATFTIPNEGLLGTNTANLKVELFPNMNFDHRLEWLIRYPYGCVEQTTSSVFPQLYLKSFVPDVGGKHKKIDKNINAGIERLIRFQTSSGGMAYWPGNTSVSEWSSIYVAHFLTEANNKGYHVPSYLYDNLIEYLERKARYGSGEVYTRVYRAYVLSLAEESNISSEINNLRQDSFDKLNDVQKHMLAAAYYNTGKRSTAEEILQKANKEYEEYDDFTYHFGSVARDMGAVLSTLVDMEETEEARLLAEEIARMISARDWYSTHSLSYMLLSLGKYFDMIGIGEDGANNLNGYYILDGEKVTFGPATSINVDFKKGFGKQLQVYLDSGSEVEMAYASLSWSGVPIIDTREAASERIELDVEWLDEYGRSIDPSMVSQATTIYGHFKVKKNTSVNRIREVALVQILPSGWEIENLRLSGDQLPGWTSDWKLNYEDYVDIRDDRIMWFFDLRSNPLDFIVKINVVTQGSYYMPPTIVEAMYNNNYHALKPGQKVRVVGMGR